MILLDAGALIAIDRGDRATAALLRTAGRAGLGLRTHPMIVAQVWRDSGGRQAQLAAALKAVEVIAIDDGLGRRAGALCGVAGTNDPIDAALVALAADGDHVLTSDPSDIASLLEAARIAARVISV